MWYFIVFFILIVLIILFLIQNIKLSRERTKTNIRRLGFEYGQYIETAYYVGHIIGCEIHQRLLFIKEINTGKRITIKVKEVLK